MPNHLARETSPYLLQHANNPVDWYAWGPEALQKARDENKPIFLSIGYAACHWCHVMEHESFEDPSTAQLLNQHFVSIKVDREERPDLDSLYMSAVVAMTGQGGWPMSVFLTPQGEPFYGGTYFPPVRRYNMPAFREVLEAIAQSWQNEGEEMRRVGRQLAEHLRESNTLAALTGPAGSATTLRPNLGQQAAQALLNTYEWEHGGWGRAPRFPQPMSIEFLLMQATRGNDKALQAAVHALEQMRRGGMYDLVGGGFHRYSVDDEWLVPHFEKMLYDNAQLALVYLHAHLLTGSESFRRACTETLDFILREMTHPEGGFYSSLDADSEGQEGKYYVWTRAELQALLSAEEWQLLEQVAPLPARGNFEGALILQYTEAPEALAARIDRQPAELLEQLDGIYQKLRAQRSTRVRPATDDKVLVSWNALALRALAEAGRYLHRADYLAAAQKNASFVLREMRREGHLLRAWRDGQARHQAYLEDYAGLSLALLALYQSDPDPRWFSTALELAEEMVANFRDPAGGFFDTGLAHEDLLARPKDVQDNATPSGNGLAVMALLQLAAYQERGDWRAIAEGMLIGLQDLLVKHAMAFGMWLQALDFATGPVQQVAIVGPLDNAETRQLIETIWTAYRPRVVAAAAPSVTPGSPDLLRDRLLVHGQPTAYVCQGFTCRLPVNEPAALLAQLEATYQE